MRRLIATALSCVTVVLGPAMGHALGQSISISEPFHFTENRGSNSVGSRSGYGLVLGAEITPSGLPTLAKATQGSRGLLLQFLPFTVKPNHYRWSIRFNPALTGSWRIAATRNSESARPVPTPAIANPQAVPLVENLRVVGTGLMPQLIWNLPDLTGFDVDRIRVTVMDDHRLPVGVPINDMIFVSEGLAPNTTTFTIPAGVLEFGRTYVFRVMLEDLEGNVLENRSSTFTRPFSPVG